MQFKKRQPAIDRSRRVTKPVQRNTVFSYHASRSPRLDNAPRTTEPAIRKEKSRTWLKTLPNLGIAVIVLGAVFLSLRLSADVRIEPVAIEQKDQVFLREHKAYRDAASREFAAFFNGNKLTVDTDRIAANLRREFPELSATSVSLPFIGNQPIVYVQPATPKLILSTTSSGLYVLDATGRALITGNQVMALEELDIPVVNDQSGIHIEVGQIALPRATVTFIDEVWRQLRAKNIDVTSLTLPAGTNELHLRIDGVGYYVKFNVYGNAREEAGGYLTLKAKLESEKKTPREYIDVRVPGRSYYK